MTGVIHQYFVYQTEGSGRWNPNDYDTVESRIAKFWKDHPEGRVLRAPAANGASR